MARLTKKQAYDLGYKNGFTMASEDGSSDAPSDGWDSLLINADPAFVKEKFGWDSQDSDDEATSLLDEYCKGCQAGADAACGGGEKAEIMASEAKAGFVVGDNGEIYVQLPADNQFGFVICDEDQSWDGGVGSGLKSWTLLKRDDERITNADRMRLDWVFDKWIDEYRPVVEVCNCTEWVRENDLYKDGIDESDWDDAANDYAGKVFTGLQERGFEVSWPKGDRSLYHQWNGAHFATKRGCVASWQKMTEEQIEAIDEAREAAQAEVNARWVREKLDFPFATDGESGTIKAESFEDACEQLESMFAKEALADGAWGWVENTDGYRHAIGIEPGKVAGD